MTEPTLPVPSPEAPPPAPGPGFWSVLGATLLGGARLVGKGASAVYHAVDPDARRDIAQMPVLALTVLGPRHVPVKPQPDDGHRPIIFVHGLGGHRGNFLPLRSWLFVNKRRRAYSIGLPADADLRELGRRLGAYIDEVIQVNELGEDGQVDVVGHSMGGVVARLAVLDLAVARRVHTIVTLGTPHAGTQAARFAGTDRCLDLRPDSEVMRLLGQQVPWRGPSRLVCFWSTADPLMQPAETAWVEGADNRELEGISHIEYLLDRGTWRQIHKVLWDPR